jgi:hypothetical protein
MRKITKERKIDKGYREIGAPGVALVCASPSVHAKSRLKIYNIKKSPRT